MPYEEVRVRKRQERVECFFAGVVGILGDASDCEEVLCFGWKLSLLSRHAILPLAYLEAPDLAPR